MALGDCRLLTNRYLKQIEAMKLPEDVTISFKVLIDHWRFLTCQIHELRRSLQRQADKDCKLEKVYQSVPGVGIVTSRTLANELGNLSRFDNERALFSYTGLTPSEFWHGSRIGFLPDTFRHEDEWRHDRSNSNSQRRPRFGYAT
jgi:transposase